MGAAWLLTLLALGGVIAGVLLGQPRRFSSYLAAAGGGLLLGITLFWLMPEIAATTGWAWAFGLAFGAGGVMALFDRFLNHGDHALRSGLAGPLLAAAAIHSFLDGWSVRVLAGQPVAALVVPLGLALHKVPEGLALGWITRNVMSMRRAIAVSGAVEAVTLAGALVEPRANQTGAAEFGTWWTAIVLAVISGSFLFLAFHAVAPARRKAGVIPLFIATLLVVAAAAAMERGML